MADVSKIKLGATTYNIKDANAARSDHTHNYLPLTGGTLSGKLTVGTTSQSAAPTASITVHDTRNYTWTPTSLDKGVNWYFTMTNSPDTSKWWSIMHINGWTGDYNAWELAGPSHNTDQRTQPLYIRSGRTTNGWGAWRKIYDTSNKPSASDVGAATSNHTHSFTPTGTITVQTAGSTTSITPVSSKNVVTSASGATASVANCVLTLTNGSFGTGASVTTGTAITVKTGDAAYKFTGTAGTTGTPA